MDRSFKRTDEKPESAGQKPERMNMVLVNVIHLEDSRVQTRRWHSWPGRWISSTECQTAAWSDTNEMWTESRERWRDEWSEACCRIASFATAASDSMNVWFVPREVRISISTMDQCASTSRSFALDGLAAAPIGLGKTLERHALPNFQRAKVSCCSARCVASSRAIVKRHDFDFGRRRRRFSLEEAYGAGIGDSRVRAMEDAESDPLGPGYWDRAEGKKQMEEIEDMKELIAEAERLNKASQTDSASAEEREERARQAAAKLREELAKVSELPPYQIVWLIVPQPNAAFSDDCPPHSSAARKLWKLSYSYSCPDWLIDSDVLCSSSKEFPRPFSSPCRSAWME